MPYLAEESACADQQIPSRVAVSRRGFDQPDPDQELASPRLAAAKEARHGESGPSGEQRCVNGADGLHQLFGSLRFWVATEPKDQLDAAFSGFMDLALPEYSQRMRDLSVGEVSQDGDLASVEESLADAAEQMCLLGGALPSALRS